MVLIMFLENSINWKKKIKVWFSTRMRDIVQTRPLRNKKIKMKIVIPIGKRSTRLYTLTIVFHSTITIVVSVYVIRINRFNLMTRKVRCILFLSDALKFHCVWSDKFLFTPTIYFLYKYVYSHYDVNKWKSCCKKLWKNSIFFIMNIFSNKQIILCPHFCIIRWLNEFQWTNKHP